MSTFSPCFKITNKITASLTAIERAKGFLEAVTLSADWIKKMQNRALVLEAHCTTHIEGTTLTLEESEQLLAGKTLAAVDPDDTKELLNYRDAFEFVADYLDSDAPLTEGLVREIHKNLVAGVRGNAAAPGEYRKIQNYVVNSKTKEVIYTPPPAYDVPLMMSELLAWVNAEQEINPILIAGIAQFQFVHIHPFLDGNGRSARLLSTLYLYRSGYDFKRLFSLSEFYDRDRASYYQAIQSVRAQNMDMTIWLEYFCKGLATQLNEIKEEGARAIKHDVLVKQFHLSKRQGRAVEYVLHNGSIAIHDYERLCDKTPRRTLQRELKELVDKNVLVAEGATHKLTYKMRTA